MTEQGRPPVAVSVGHRVAAPADVVEAEPWRPSRRQRRAAVAVLVLLAVAGGLAGVADHRRRAAATRAGQAIAVTVLGLEGSDVEAAVAVTLRVSDTGTSGLAVRGLHLDAPGWRVEGTVPRSLPRGGGATVRLTSTWDCGRAVTLPRRVLLDVAAPGGAGRTLQAPLGTDTDRLRELRAGTCGAVGTSDAVSVDRSRSLLRGDEIVVEARLLNRSREPVVLEQASVEGFAVRDLPALPLALGGRAPGTPAGPPVSYPLRFVLELGPCPAPGLSVDEPARPKVGMDLVLRGRDGSAATRLYVDGLADLVAVAHIERCGTGGG